MSTLRALLLALIAFSCATAGEAPATVECPQCHGAGTAPCAARGCVDGKVLCPGPCLKKEVGPWVKKKVPGHSDDELWRSFTNPDGSGYNSWTQAHVGEAIEQINGKWTNTGKCPKCAGTTRVTCAACQGKGLCSLCKGAKQVASDVAARFQKAAEERQRQSQIRLKDGSIVEGKVMGRMGGKTVVRTADGKLVEIKDEELAEQPTK